MPCDRLNLASQRFAGAADAVNAREIHRNNKARGRALYSGWQLAPHQIYKRRL